MGNLKTRVAALESAAPHVAELAALPRHLRPLAGASWLAAWPMAGQRTWYAWPPGPFNHEHMHIYLPETVPPGAIELTRQDLDTLAAAGCVAIRVEYVDDWRADGLPAPEVENEQP